MSVQEEQVKVVIIGTVGVGKSSIAKRYVSNLFDEHLESTLGAVYLERCHTYESRTVKFQLWDTAGQERFKAIAKIYYKDAKVALGVYDVTNRSSFEGLKQWVNELFTHGSKDISILQVIQVSFQFSVLAIVGNKLDLLGSYQPVPQKEALDYAKGIGALFKVTSAKDGQGIQALFDLICSQLPYAKTRTQNNLSLLANNKEPPTKKKCC